VPLFSPSYGEHGSLGCMCSWRDLCASGGGRQARGHRQGGPQEGRQATPLPSCGRGVGLTPRRSTLARGGLESRRAPTVADPGAAAVTARAGLRGAWESQGHGALLQVAFASVCGKLAGTPYAVNLKRRRKTSVPAAFRCLRLAYRRWT